MARLNQAGTRTRTPNLITSEPVSSGETHQGGVGFKRDAKSELFLTAVSTFSGEDNFYEQGRDRNSRIVLLVHQVAEDYEWISGFARWLRRDANMRTVSIVIALEAVHARLAKGIHGGNRQLVDSVLARPDEPGEALAYWQSTFGRSLPMPVKRGIADAAIRLYGERGLVKWDSSERPYRFADVLELTHPGDLKGSRQRLRFEAQGDLFEHAIDRRHNRDNPIPESLATLIRRNEILSMPVGARRAFLAQPDAAERLADAGITWEALAGWLQGPMDAKAWEAIIPSMGYMALLRNLRNFDQAGISAKTVKLVLAKLADQEQVTRSRQLPMRFLSAYKAVSTLRWGPALEEAVNLSLQNVPELSGRTLILVDTSVSMKAPLSARSDLSRMEAASVFGSALALRAERADLVQFGTESELIKFHRSDSLLPLTQKFNYLGGTQTTRAVQKNFIGQDRVVIVTDEQAGYDSGSYDSRRDPMAVLPKGVRGYTWNLAGYERGHAPSTADHHVFGGLSDKGFDMIPLIEAGATQRWPWEK